MAEERLGRFWAEHFEEPLPHPTDDAERYYWAVQKEAEHQLLTAFLLWLQSAEHMNYQETEVIDTLAIVEEYEKYRGDFEGNSPTAK
jgi:hypothetical protein